jgi:hypothetical protein
VGFRQIFGKKVMKKRSKATGLSIENINETGSYWLNIPINPSQ